MVLIPEEKLIRYEKQLNEQVEDGPTNSQTGLTTNSQQSDGGIHIPTNCQTGGSTFPIHYPGGNYPYRDYRVMYGRGEEDDERSMPVEMIVRSIPKSMKKRAEALLAHLKEREDMITWDDMGQVLLNGVLIPRSNIADLVSDAMRPRKNFNPVGVHEFYKVLKDINIPKDIVRNEQRWNEGVQKEKQLWLTL